MSDRSEGPRPGGGRRWRWRGGAASIDPAAPALEPGTARLCDLEPGAEGTILRMHGAGRLHRRLLEMGFTEGTRIRVAREAPLGDPVDYEVRGYHVSLRRSEACLIIVRREP